MSRAAPMLRSPAIRLAFALLLAGTLLLISGFDPGVLCVLPALVMAFALLSGRYPGERRLTALRERSRVKAPRLRECASARRRPRAIITIPRGGLLIGYCLAVRPPPISSSAS
ncbi:MAG: hypothetical protein ACRDK2_16905 [Solirubrobacteraceae bacterium]